MTPYVTLKNDLVVNGCRVCGARVLWTSGGFIRHIGYAHPSVTPQLYYENDVLGFRPLCECGCAQKTVWQCRGGFYQRYVNGHNYRGKTKATDVTVALRTEKAKQHPNMKASWFCDEHTSWNTGLKLGDDPRWDEACHKRNVTKSTWTSEHKTSIYDKIGDTAKQNFELGLRISPFTIVTSEQRREWMERACATRATNGFHSQRGFENGWHLSTKNNREHHYESSWERVRMELLDVDPTVVTWKKCDFIVPYWSSEKQKTRRYTPDFLITYVDGRTIIEEVKGWMTVEVHDKARAGMMFATKQGWEYKLTRKVRNSSTFVEISFV